MPHTEKNQNDLFWTSAVARDVNQVQLSLESSTDKTTSLLSTFTDMAMNELANVWLVSVVKNLKKFTDGPTQKLIEVPERKMSKPLKYVYKRYAGVLRHRRLKITLSVERHCGEWWFAKVHRVFFSADEKLDLEGQRFWPPSINTPRARLFDR